MNKIFNVIWFLTIGLVTGIIFLVAGIIYSISGIGASCGQELFKTISYLMTPFGDEYDTDFTSNKLANIIWILLFGWWLIVLYVAAGIFLFVSLFGIPFAIKCFRLLPLIACPIGSKTNKI